MEIQEFSLWNKLAAKRAPVSFDLELTARCNNDCRHCYINLPAGDRTAIGAELTAEEVLDIGRQAVDMGVVWCLLTGGEPLLRSDFGEIYLGLKRLGLLVSVFTNACLVTDEHVALFSRYPPRDIEVTVYGASRDTYEAVTRVPGSWRTFNTGLERMLDGGLQVRLKAMALRSNLHEFDEIARFCRARTKDYFRFDPVVHLRFDGNAARNLEIRAERLTPDEIVTVERADPERFTALQRGCADGDLIHPDPAGEPSDRLGDRLFACAAGKGSFAVGYDGTFRLCSSLWQSGTTYDLHRGTLREAWEEWVPRVRAMRATDRQSLQKCSHCRIVNLCLCCPAHAALETGRLDSWVEYFCEVAQARAAAHSLSTERDPVPGADGRRERL